MNNLAENEPATEPGAGLAEASSAAAGTPGCETPPLETTKPKPNVLAPLRHGPFARYMTGEIISMVGTWMQISAQGWLLTSLTDSAKVLGAMTFASGLPMLFLTMLGGSIADKFDKRRILWLVLVTQAAAAGAIGYLVATHQIAIWHLLVSSTLLGIVAAFEVPTSAAFVPELVPPEDISNAIAFDRASFHSTRLVGPALGGWLVGAFGISSAYFVNAATFLALFIALFTIPKRAPKSKAEEEERRGGIRDGLRYVRSDEPTRAMILLIASMTIFVSPFLMVTMPVYARHVLNLGPDKMGLLMGISGIGSVIGSIGLLSIPHGRRAMATRIAAGMAVAAVYGLALAPSFWWAAASLVPLTIGLSTCFGIGNIVVQERAPDAMRGRVSAIVGLSFFGIVPFSAMLITTLVDKFGMRETLAFGATGFGIATTWLLWGRKRLATAPPTPGS